MTQVFKYRAPVSRADLLGLLADHEAVRVMAGGTDLLVDIRNGFGHPEMVVNLKNVDGYTDISWSESEGLAIGAAVTINDVLRSERIRESLPAARRLRARSGVVPDPQPRHGGRQRRQRLAVLGHGAGAAVSGRPGRDRVTARGPGRAVLGVLPGREADGPRGRRGARADRRAGGDRRRPRRIPQAQADQGPRPRHRRRRPHEEGRPAAPGDQLVRPDAGARRRAVREPTRSRPWSPRRETPSTRSATCAVVRNTARTWSKCSSAS